MTALLRLLVLGTMMTAVGAHAQPPGSTPQVPLTWESWQRLKDDPAALQALSAHLPPVAAESVARMEAPLTAPAGSPPAVFSPENAPVGAWSSLANTQTGGPFNLSNPILLTDGTVLLHRTDTADWWKLTPDSSGSYVNGTWSQAASMPVINGIQYAPKFFASAVLPDGRVVVEGGQYNDGAAVWTNLGAVYDPVADVWTAINAPQGWTQIGNAQSTVLANGSFMLADCCDAGPNSALLNATNLTWTATGTGKFDSYAEEAWALLPSGKVLTVDAYVGTGTCGTGTEIYDPGTGAWSSAGNVPSQLSDCNTSNGNNGTYKLGLNVLTYNGSTLAFGGTTSTTVPSPIAIYSVANNSWSAGANLPALCGSGNQSCTMADAPAAVMPNGNILIATSAGLFTTPANFFEYSPSGNSYAAASTTADASATSSFYYNFLVLPTGQVLSVETYSSNIQIYTPSGAYQSSWQPVVTNVTSCVAPNGTYAVSGNQLNGLTQGGYYGNNVQAATNYPLVRIINNSSGHVFYARTSNLGTMSVAPNAASSTSFKVATNTETGPSTLYVVANGVPSVGTPITVSGTCEKTATHDFNGDGKSDIAWSQTSGLTAVWLMNGAQISQSGSYGVVGNTWQIIGQRDFNGDGYSDWLWRDGSSNTVAIWLLNGLQVIGAGSLGVVPGNWTVAGTSDFNGDGKGDILWRDSNTGTVAIWLMNGLQVTQAGSIGVVPSNWNIVATDGKGDIFWRDSNTYTVAIWVVSGLQVTQSASLGVVPGNWSILGVGDFDGNGSTDILWQDSNTGTVAIWLRNGLQVMQAGSLGVVANNWAVAETGDFNGDGNSDILWRDSNTGTVAIWFMNGLQVSSASAVGVVPVASGWTIQGLNAD